ncbi:MAG: hypothetical protein EOO08_11375 [Chitinophagaceae bacterium]|nr:MAG: hypothetical protein EOO08_11375 [Chitinophagaceae bacterium]
MAWDSYIYYPKTTVVKGMVRRLISLWVPFLFALAAFGQKRTLSATRAETAPKIDGEFDEPAWQTAPVASHFIQNYPDYGKPSRHQTEVRVLYDDEALYIAAKLYDDPAQVRRQLTARDAEGRQDVDYFSVFLDTYNDQQNGFQFLVTSANVQSDARLSSGGNAGFGDFGDKSWDAVWQSATKAGKDGWMVELRIPYISLRFTRKDVQTWGLQFLRLSRRDNENSYWNTIDPNVNGFVNQFGRLEGLQAIRPPLRLSFSPYVLGGVRFNPEGSRKRTEVLRSGGMDVKWGLSRSFTLDATLIPDFGQVVSDNLVNNLTPYELRFQENRPFFTEGTELFNKAGIFYSRRIGATPSGYSAVENNYGRSTEYEIVSNPTLTQLYNGVKFSGRTAKKLGIGVFNAVTAPMRAKLRRLDTKQDSLILTEPMANYNLFVLDQALRGRSSVTLTSATVIRDGASRDANTSALDWSLYNRRNTHVFSGALRASNVLGYTPYSSNYFYYTDTVNRDGHVVLRPYSGFAGRLRVARVSGHWRYAAAVNVESDKYDPNDLGYLQSPNEVTYSGNVSYNVFEPTRHFINYSYTLSAYQSNLYRPYKYGLTELTANFFAIFRNFWDLSLTVGAVPAVQNDYFELRNMSYSLQRPDFYYASMSGSSDSRKKMYVSVRAGYEHSSLAHSPYYELFLGTRYRFSNRFLLQLDLQRSEDALQIGSAYQPDPAVVGYRNSLDFTSVLSGTYNFTARMNVSLRARHYWNNVRYLSFYRVNDKGAPMPHAFIPGQDLNYNVFNIDAFYTWDFRPGSRIILGWKNSTGGTYDIDGMQFGNYKRNLARSFDLSHANELSLRVIYFLDYNQLRKKR